MQKEMCRKKYAERTPKERHIQKEIFRQIYAVNAGRNMTASQYFQPCITLGGLHWAEMGQKNDFLKKNALKTAFWGDTILDRLTSEGAGTPILTIFFHFSMFPFNFGP